MENALNKILTFKDFLPKMISSGGLFYSAEYETLEQTMPEINTWLEANPIIQIINIETVVLPNMYRRNGNYSAEFAVSQSNGKTARWNQFFRVWYMQENLNQ